MVSTKQTTNGNSSVQTVVQTALAESANEFSDYSNFDELDEYRDDAIDESGFDDDFDPQFDTVEEIDVEAGVVGYDAPPEESNEPAAALEAGDEPDNYSDYVPEGLALDDSSEFDEYAPEEVAEIEPSVEAEPAAEVNAAAIESEQPEEFEEYSTPPAVDTGSEFDDIDEFDYQPSLEVDAEEEPTAEQEPEEELESDEEGEEEGYDPDAEEEEADEFIDPRASKSKVSLSSNPLMKAAFIGAAGLVFVLVGGSMYSLLSGGGQAKDPAAANLETTVEPTVAELPESGKLKAELAFSSQQNDLDKAKRLQQAGQVKPSPTPSATPSPQAQAITPAPAPMPLPLPMMPPVAAPSMPEMAAAAPVDPYADLSPVERWQAIASMGSFGRANPSARPATVAAAPVAVPSAPVAPPASARPASSGGNSLSQIRSASSTPGMRSAPLADVLVGTTAGGAMTTAVVLGGDNSEAVNPTAPNAVKYLVTLTSPIKDATGAVAIPAGATLVSVVSGFSTQTGMMQLMVKGVLYNNKEYAAPDGAILIRGEDGASLRASRTGGGSPILSAILPSVLQGASQAASTLTQNRGTTVTNGSVTTTSGGGSPNVGAGFIQGAGQALAQQITQATQAANSTAQGRPQSWKLSEGKGVQIFVNNTFQM